MFMQQTVIRKGVDHVSISRLNSVLDFACPIRLSSTVVEKVVFLGCSKA
jgi:hypothetical protein